MSVIGFLRWIDPTHPVVLFHDIIIWSVIIILLVISIVLLWIRKYK